MSISYRALRCWRVLPAALDSLAAFWSGLLEMVVWDRAWDGTIAIDYSRNGVTID